MMRRIVLIAGGLAAVVSGSLNAGELREQRSLTSALAVQAASAAVEACGKSGFPVSAAVVDNAGHLLALVRADGGAPHTVSTAERKAYTALSSRMPTSQLTKIVAGNADAAGMRNIEGFLILDGGLPIKAGDSVVGAIGVSGSPGPGDEKCSAAGIAAIAASLK